LEPGTLIRGKYRIIRLLGRGGMGTVYQAEHILLGRQRALKFISSELSQDATFLRRFRREAQAATELLHPNVVQVVDLDQAEDGSPYIAMEYVDGPDLRHALSQGVRHTDSDLDLYQGTTSVVPQRRQNESGVLTPEGIFAVPRALHIARGITQGLGAAHAKGIVHRDVKPENILLAHGPNGEEIPKLLDFGIAAMKESATVSSRTHGLLLTPPYAAPEQWKGMAAEELDGRTDLYALGGVLYEMLTGRPPFHAHNTEGWMYQHLHEQPQPPSLLRPELAKWPGLDALVLRLLAKDRDQRFPSAAGLLEALTLTPSQARAATVIQPTPAPRTPTVVEPPPPPIPPPARKPVDPVPSPVPEPVDDEPSFASVPSRKLPIKWLAAAAVLILVVAGIWFATRPSTTVSPESSLPVGAFVWTDPATGLMWAKKDNGSNVNWQQATDYCRNLQEVGHSDWRLPTIGELQGIYDASANVGVDHVKGNLTLSGWSWSSSRGNASGEAMNFHFNNGTAYSGGRNYSFSGRALCVRGSSSKGPTPAVNPAPVAPAPDNQKPKADPNDVWTDPATGLMWTKKDYGVLNHNLDAVWQQGGASAYCKNLKMDGFSDWSLPSIDELAALYDTTQSRNIIVTDDYKITYHIKGGIILSGMAAWSKTSTDADGEVKGFDFSDGRRRNDPYGDTEGSATAICVRHPGK
jgi:serine/threonine protein kinase